MNQWQACACERPAVNQTRMSDVEDRLAPKLLLRSDQTYGIAVSNCTCIAALYLPDVR